MRIRNLKKSIGSIPQSSGYYLVILMIVGIFNLPRAASAIWVNIGSIVTARTVMPQQSGSLYEYPRNTVQLPKTVRRAYELALRLDSLNTVARRGLGRAALASRNDALAMRTLSPLENDYVGNQFVYIDVITAFSRNDQPEKVIKFYKTNPPPLRSRVISDTVALAYLRQGDLDNAYNLRPGDLYVNHHLWQQVNKDGDLKRAEIYEDALTNFSLEAIDPADPGLLAYTDQVVPALLENGLWGRQRTLNVISFLAWVHYQATEVERLLESVSEQYPEEPEWSFYLGELYHRRRNFRRAEQLYRRVLEIDPEYAPAYLRMGMIAAQLGMFEEAARWYEHYHQMMPDDLLGLKKLAEACGMLKEEQIENASCRKTERWFEEKVIAVSESSNRGKQGELLLEWRFENERVRRNFDRHAAFAPDALTSFEGVYSGSVIGFSPSYHGGLATCRRVELEPNTTYVFSGYFKTQDWGDLRAKVLYWGSRTQDKQWAGGGQQQVIRGNRDWAYEELVFTPPKETSFMLVCPLLLYNFGQAWMDDVELRAFIDVAAAP